MHKIRLHHCDAGERRDRELTIWEAARRIPASWSRSSRKKKKTLRGKIAISRFLRLLELEVPHGGLGSLPHEGKVPLQLLVGVCEGVVVPDAAQLVCPGGSQGPLAAHQNGAHSDLVLRWILSPDVDGQFHTPSLEQEAHEVPRAPDGNYGYGTKRWDVKGVKTLL